MSYHPELFKNIRNEKFKVQLPETKTGTGSPKTQPILPLHQEEPEEDLNTAFIFNQQIQFTNQKTNTPMETGTIIFIGLLLIATELVYRSPILNFYVRNILTYLKEKLKRR
jgi:hypothetical protein